jgi:hypothetical protein
VSHHEIPARDPAHRVIVGWDPPLMTFFAQVIDRRREVEERDDKMILWRGCKLRELYEVEDLVRVVERYAELTAEMCVTLYGDKDEGR